MKRDARFEAPKYMVVLEREGQVAVYREGNIYRRYSIPTFDRVKGVSPEKTIVKEYKAKMGYEIINLVFKGIINKTVDETGKIETLLLYKGTECYGREKSDQRSATEWIPKERLHRYQKGGDVARSIVALTDERCSVFTYNLNEKEPFKKQVCMIDCISKKHVHKAAEVVRLGFRTVANTYAFSEKEFPNYAAYMTDQKLWHYMREKNHYVFAYFDDERILGVISLEHNKRTNTATLSLFAVHPEYRHSKIGESLLDYAIKYAKNLSCGKVVGEIMVENTKFKNWISNQGFSVDKIYESPYCPYKIGVVKKMI